MSDLDIFLNAPDDPAPGELEAYLDKACGADRELRQRVDSLFAADGSAGDFLGEEIFEVSEGGEKEPGDLEGSVVGDYRLLQKIGEGGFGVIYMADQLEPVKRRVALKVIKLGMDTRQVVARFEAERQALAMMDHAHIARVFDAGATESGRPYFVMELVRGIPITEFCEEEGMKTAGRLALFLDVLSAVQHAHQKGIVHRDLKPTNVLVTMHDDKPVAKVIDFGVAKATQGELTDKTLFTRFEQFIGTPAYMSPEQTQMSGLDIDTRSDIYSLGVLLYELLTGTTPLDGRTLAAEGQDEIRRLIREVDPPKPSTRLRSTIAGRVRNPIRGGQRDLGISDFAIDRDLDWVVMKALEKDRTRRYETASEFSADLRRYLDHEPVEAGAPGAAYRWRKFARRNRGALLALCSIVFFLIAGVAVSAWFAIDAKRAEEKAEQIGEAALASRDSVRLSYAEEQLSAGKTRLGMAHLVRLIRERSSNHRIAAARLMSVFWQREFQEEEFSLETLGLFTVTLNRDGSKLLVGRKDGGAEVLDSSTGQPHPDGKPMKLEAGLPVQIVVFHPDSTLVALCYEDPEKKVSAISIWDWRRGEQVCPPITHEGVVQSLAFSPVGRSILVASAGTGEVWGIDQGEAHLETTINSPGFKARYSPSGKFILATGQGRLLDAKTGEEIRRFRHPGSNLFFAHFSPDESQVVTASPDRTARIWDRASGELLHSLPHDDQVLEARFSTDGRLVVTASPDGKARVWASTSGRLLQEFDHGDEIVMQADITADGRALVSATWSGVYSWDLFSGTSKPQSYGPPTTRQVIHLSDDPSLMLISSPFRGASVWRLRNAQPKSQILRHQRATNRRPHGDVIWQASFRPDGNQVISSGSDQAARLWNSYTSEQILPVFNSGYGWHAGFSPDQSEILVASLTWNRIHVIDALTGDEILDEPIRSEGKPHYAAYSPIRNEEGDYLVVVAGIGSRSAQIFNTRTGQPVGKPLLHHGAGSFNPNVISDLRVMFSPNGDQVIVGTDDGTAGLFAVPSGDLLLTLKGDDGHHDLLQSVRFDPTDGRRVVTASSDGTAIIWRVAGPEAGQVIHRLIHGQDIVTYAEFSPDGRKVLTASMDGTARIWDAGTGELIGIPMVHRGGVLVAKFASDSKRVVTASMDHTTRIWDAATGHALSDPLWHDGGTTWVDIHQNGDRLVTAGIDSTARIWEHPALPDGEVPDWLAQWATAVSGLELGEDDVVRELEKSECEEIKESVVARADDGFYGKTVRWFYSDKKVRPITPFSRISVPQWVEHRIGENTIESLASALAISPNHPRALSELAHALASKASYEGHENLVRAWHLMDRAVRGDPTLAEWVSPFEVDRPRFSPSYFKLLAVRLRSGDAADWQEICRRILEQYEESSVPGELERVVKICSLVPLPDDLNQQLRKLATKGEGIGRGAAWDAVAWAMAAYRAGEYEAADTHSIDAVKRAATMEWKLGGDLCRSLALTVQAMARAQLGQNEEAAGLLKKAKEELSQLKSSQVGNNWPDVIFVEVLLEEATRVLGEAGTR